MGVAGSWRWRGNRVRPGGRPGKSWLGATRSLLPRGWGPPDVVSGRACDVVFYWFSASCQLHAFFCIVPSAASFASTVAPPRHEQLGGGSPAGCGGTTPPYAGVVE